MGYLGKMNSLARGMDSNYHEQCAATKGGARKTMSETMFGMNLIFPYLIAKINKNHSNQKKKARLLRTKRHPPSPTINESLGEDKC